MKTLVADLCDDQENDIQVLEPSFKSYGGNTSCAGIIRTIKIDQNPYENRSILSENGNGNILVVDALANSNGAVIGDVTANIAIENNWQGIIVNGYIRDTAMLRNMPISIWALGTCPKRGIKKNPAERSIKLSFGGVIFKPNNFLYADEDGIIISERELR